MINYKNYFILGSGIRKAEQEDPSIKMLMLVLFYKQLMGIAYAKDGWHNDEGKRINFNIEKEYTVLWKFSITF